jgi:hypothetical protein
MEVTTTRDLSMLPRALAISVAKLSSKAVRAAAQKDRVSGATLAIQRQEDAVTEQVIVRRTAASWNRGNVST